ncbi:hypothetical protein TrCOL_g8477 [Triparma columacea]|uniref:Diphthamide biosynthesis protein 3 n=1 Tax=Triparma columacea TaxID=722753 RepID=A0A9W7L4D3_9STRA|nr:hypothetical protein TrCOL_g8477 [Triparma columacea]
MSYYDEIEIEDMTYSPVTQEYTYPCPCGDNFLISLEELYMGEDVAPCPSCTLLIKVIYEEEDLPELRDGEEGEEGEEEGGNGEGEGKKEGREKAWGGGEGGGEKVGRAKEGGGRVAESEGGASAEPPQSPATSPKNDAATEDVPGSSVPFVAIAAAAAAVAVVVLYLNNRKKRKG